MNGSMITFLAEAILWSGFAALGFALLFNVPVRTLFGCFVAGAVGNASKLILMHFGADIEEATLAGAIIVGLLGALFGRIWHAPVMVFSIPGAIPMVPGSFAFKAMIGMVQLSRLGFSADPELLVQTGVMAAKTALVLGALAMGIAVPRLLLRRDRPLG